jgi:prepilin-type N-terminal cleavage/methylation domain-containing protein
MTHRPSAPLPRRSAGFSLIELLLVVVIVGVLALLAIPKFKTVSARNEVTAARQKVEALVATARASAIHKGRQSLFFASGNWVSVWTQDPTTGAWVVQVPYQNLSVAHPSVSLQLGGSGWWYVWYDARGVTWSKPPSTTVFRIVGSSGMTDSVCVTRLGQILPRGCST